MYIEDLRRICKKLPGVTEDMKWENHLCFSVGGKMFLVTSPDLSPATASFKVSDDEFAEISSRDGFAPAQYLARYKWIWISDIKKMGKKEWEHYIKQSYELVKAKLPKKKIKELV